MVGGTHPHLDPELPEGIVVSLGVVINNAMQPAVAVVAELAGVATAFSPWFAPIMHGGFGVGQHQRINEMIGGVKLVY